MSEYLEFEFWYEQLILFGVSVFVPTRFCSDVSRAPGSAIMAMPPNVRFEGASGTNQDMEATSADLIKKECKGCSEARKPIP